MRSPAVGLVLTLILAVSAMILWREAGRVFESAEAQRRLVTLRYSRADGIGGEATGEGWWTSLLERWHGTDSARRAAASYWLADYAPLGSASSSIAAPPEPALRFIAANAAYRQSPPVAGDQKARVSRLDAVIQMYAGVLRDDPSNADAAYNYELVSRLRDVAARARPGAKNTETRPATESLESASFDLPPGPTLHGSPGGPPATVPMGDFKATTPMSYEEREQMPEPTAGSRLRRRG